MKAYLSIVLGISMGILGSCGKEEKEPTKVKLMSLEEADRLIENVNLGALDTDAIEKIETALKTQPLMTDEIPRKLVGILGKIGQKDERAVGVLIDLGALVFFSSGKSHQRVQDEAMWSLVELAPYHFDIIKGRLIAALKKDDPKDPQAYFKRRARAAVVLGFFNDPSKDPDLDIRNALIFILTARPEDLKLSKKDAAHIQQNAAWALGNIARDSADGYPVTAALVRALTHEFEAVRDDSARALGQLKKEAGPLTWSTLVSRLTQNTEKVIEMRITLIDALSKLVTADKKEDFKTLLNTLKSDPSSKVRVHASDILKTL